MSKNDLSAASLARLLPAGREFIPTFNGLRAVSILIVMIDHAIPWKVIPGGFAVSIFFFISGFLITRLLIDEHNHYGTLDLKKFYISRAFRLFPALFFALVYALLVTYLLGFQQSIAAIFSVIFYFSNYVHGINNELLPTIGMDPAWSLAVEEHFYLIYPIIMLTALASQRRAMTVVIAAIVIAAVLRLIYVFTLSNELSPTYIYTATETRMHFIAYGYLAALICNSPASANFVEFLNRPAVFIGAVGLILISLGVRDHYFRGTIRYYFQGLALFAIIPVIVFGSNFILVRKFLNFSLMDWIGRISYSLYLFHFASLYVGAYVAKIFIPAAGPGAIVVGAVIGGALSFVLASMSYYWIEQPCLKLRRRLLGRSAATTTQPDVERPAVIAT